VLGFGNLTFQIAVPAPQEDQYLIGQKVLVPQVPIFAFMDE
jgi:hypothetical protein